MRTTGLLLICLGLASVVCAGVTERVDEETGVVIRILTDTTGHNLYLLDLDSGRQGRILHEPQGTIGGPPAISVDGTRIACYVYYPAAEDRPRRRPELPGCLRRPLTNHGECRGFSVVGNEVVNGIIDRLTIVSG